MADDGGSRRTSSSRLTVRMLAQLNVKGKRKGAEASGTDPRDLARSEYADGDFEDEEEDMPSPLPMREEEDRPSYANEHKHAPIKPSGRRASTVRRAKAREAKKGGHETLMQPHVNVGADREWDMEAFDELAGKVIPVLSAVPSRGGKAATAEPRRRSSRMVSRETPVRSNAEENHRRHS